MASFFEKNKRKSALALLLLFLKWRKGLAPLLLIVALLMLMSFAPGNLMGICLAGMAKMPGGAHFAAAITWSASKVGMEIGGVPRQKSYRDYVGAFRLAGDQGFSGLLEKRSFKDLINAFQTARYDRNAAMNLLFHNGAAGSGTGAGYGAGSGLDMVKGGYDAGGAGAMGLAGKIGGAKSVSGVMTPGEAKDAGSGENGVALDESDLEGERAGMVDSAFASGLGKMNPGDLLGGSGAYASKAFFGAPGDMGKAGAMGAPGKKGADGSSIGKFRNGMSAKGGGAKLAQTSRRGGRSMNIGRRGLRYSKALGTLRGMVTLNDQMRNGTTMEEVAGGATEQWEGSPLTGQQATLPATPPSIGGAGPSGGGGGFGGIPSGPTGGVNYPPGGNVPTFIPGDPGLICTSAELAAGKVSNGTACVDAQTFNLSDNSQRENDFDKAAADIMKALGLFVGAAVMVGIGMDLIKTGSSCLIIVGIGLVAGGLGMFGAAMGLAGDAISKGSDLMGQSGGGMDGGVLIATALSEMVLGVCALIAGFSGGSMAAFMTTAGTVASIVFALGILMIGMQELMGNSSPQIPPIDNPVADEKEKRVKANANDGSADGLPPPPADMHYETGPSGKPVLAYNYDTFAPPEQTPPNVEQELNKQKGGGDSGLPPAPKGEHYEGLDKDGNPKLVPDYVIGVAQREDANSFTGGPPTQLPPAPSGQHYEQTNGGGDPTDPKSWKLVNNYDIPKSDLKNANANKGQQYSTCSSKGPAPDGQHYEGYDCHLVKDYPTN